MKIAMGGVAMLALLIVFASRQASSPPPEENRFDAAWAETTGEAVLKKTNRLASTDPTPIKTERVNPEVPATLPVIIAQPEEEVPKRRRKSVETNVCTRHHMRKVFYGRTWRCRK